MQSIVVKSASSGIGRQIAVVLVTNGFRVLTLKLEVSLDIPEP